MFTQPPMLRRFKQIDGFSSVTLSGNPLAVVVDGEGLKEEEMLAFARWTNLSETTFARATDDERADYRVHTPPTNAAAAEWLIADGRARAPYRARQGTAIGHAGCVRISQDAQGKIWVAGTTATVVDGTVSI
jgi:predicted PhzF superfamily epimerase YddE/YHI9